METSLKIAQMLGIYYIIVGIAMLIHRKFYQKAAVDLSRTEPLHLLSSMLTLVIGILLITFHNNWAVSWPVLITIIAWLTFIKGAVRVLAPKWISGWNKGLVENERFYYSMVALVLILGAFLAFKGFGISIQV